MIRTRIFICTVLVAVCICYSNVQADMYTMDATTAADMRLQLTSTGDAGTLTYVGYNPGGAGDHIFGVLTEYGAGAGAMHYAVGFTGNLYDNNASGLARVAIGLVDPGISGDYDGFLLPVSNDDDDTWIYRAYVTTVTGGLPESTAATTYSSWSAGLGEDEQTNLIVSTPGLNYTNVTGIGFEIRWDRSLNGNRLGDDYNTSVVPTPTAVLLGILGLSAVGIKLRKYA